MEINAGGNVDINAAKSTTSYTNETEKHKGGLTAGVSGYNRRKRRYFSRLQRQYGTRLG
jgi:hypothetical protein